MSDSHRKLVSKSKNPKKDKKTDQRCQFGMFVVKEIVGYRRDGSPIYFSITKHRPV